MRKLITLYQAIHAWLFDTKQPVPVWVAVQTTQGVVYACVRMEH